MRTRIEHRRSGADVRRILEALPAWFGEPGAVDQYVRSADDPAFDSVLAVEAGSVVGVALVRQNFPTSVGLHLIAVHPAHRRSGIGGLLVEHVADRAAASGCRLLSVHTVGPSYDDESYAETRGFYERTGFVPLEEHDGLDWDGPTLILVRPLSGGRREPRTGR